MDFRENGNFYKSTYQLQVPIKPPKVLPPDKYTGVGVSNFFTDLSKWEERKPLGSEVGWETYCDTKGPQRWQKQSRLDNFKNFK